jgi:hypothetical protein
MFRRLFAYLLLTFPKPANSEVDHGNTPVSVGEYFFRRSVD